MTVELRDFFLRRVTFIVTVNPFYKTSLGAGLLY